MIVTAVAAVLVSIVVGSMYVHRTPALTDRDTIVLAESLASVEQHSTPLPEATTPSKAQGGEK